MRCVDTSRIPPPVPAEWVHDPHTPGYFSDKEPVDIDWAYAAPRQALRDRLLELIVLQDYPKTRRELFALGVH